MRQIHEVPKLSRQQQIVEVLILIQILCARGASLEAIHEEAEKAIRRITGHH